MTAPGTGALTPAGAYPTGGAGSGAGLGSQGAVIVSDDHQWLFAVNPGGNSVSSFRIRSQGLDPRSPGRRPVSPVSPPTDRPRAPALI